MTEELKSLPPSLLTLSISLLAILNESVTSWIFHDTCSSFSHACSDPGRQGTGHSAGSVQLHSSLKLTEKQ